MDLKEALDEYQKKGMDFVKTLSDEELDFVQGEIIKEYQGFYEKFPHLVDNACIAIKNILEENNPKTRILDNARKPGLN
jgi:hypothetical protein